MKTSIETTSHPRLDGYRIARIRFHQFGHRRAFLINGRGQIVQASARGWAALTIAVAQKRPGAKRFIRRDFGGAATYGDIEYFVK